MSSDSINDIELTAVTCRQFEDTIDGYFPLKISLDQMMERQGFETVLCKISHAPIMEIDGLPIDAPVPLSVRAARVGLIEDMLLIVAQDEVRGSGVWRWFGESGLETDFNPITRLAEPAFLEGVGFSRESAESEPAFFAKSNLGFSAMMASALEKIGWPQARVWAWRQQNGIRFNAQQSAVQAGSLVNSNFDETSNHSVDRSGKWLLLRLS